LLGSSGSVTASPTKASLSSSDTAIGSGQDEELRVKPTLPPDQLKQVRSAQHKIGREFSKLFQEISCDPTRGEVRLNNERHIFVRGSSISLEFVDLVEKVLEEQRDSESSGRDKRRGSTLRPADLRLGEDGEQREREDRDRDDPRRSAEIFATNFLFDFASAMGGNDHRNFLNRIVSEKNMDISFLTSLYPSSVAATMAAGGTGRNFSPSMFSDLLLFGLPTVMAYTGWGSVKFDYSTLSCSLAPSSAGPSLYVLFVVENSMEASGLLSRLCCCDLACLTFVSRARTHTTAHAHSVSQGTRGRRRGQGKGRTQGQGQGARKQEAERPTHAGVRDGRGIRQRVHQRVLAQVLGRDAHLLLPQGARACWVHRGSR
jgi:hypothetical protein